MVGGLGVGVLGRGGFYVKKRMTSSDSGEETTSYSSKNWRGWC